MDLHKCMLTILKKRYQENSYLRATAPRRQGHHQLVRPRKWFQEAINWVADTVTHARRAIRINNDKDLDYDDTASSADLPHPSQTLFTMRKFDMTHCSSCQKGSKINIRKKGRDSIFIKSVHNVHDLELWPAIYFSTLMLKELKEHDRILLLKYQISSIHVRKVKRGIANLLLKTDKRRGINSPQPLLLYYN